jgi:hypothetical protein
MLHVVVGVPGRFAAWCDAVAAALVARDADAAPQPFAADTLAELAEAALRRGAAQAAVSCRRPDGRLRAALAEAGRPFILALDDPRLALADRVIAAGEELATAVPVVASSCAAVAPCRDMPGALALHADRDAADPVSAAAAIAAHLRLDATGPEIAATVDRLAAAGLHARPPDAAALWHELDAEQQGLVTDALAPYVHYFGGGALCHMIWRRDLFFIGDSPDERATRVIDITGRARCLAHGPNILVAPGEWLVNVKLLFSREACEHEFLVELSAGRPLGAATVKPEREGPLELDFPVALDAADNHPMTLRLSNRRAAFDGATAIDVVFLYPQG